MSDFTYIAIAVALVVLVGGHTVWQLRGLFRARAADARLLASQACFRPVTVDGLPLIGAVKF